MADEDRILARAAIKLRGIRVGQDVLVDPTDPYIAAALEAGHLYPVTTTTSEDDEPPVAVVDPLPDIDDDNYADTLDDVEQTDEAAG